MSKPILELSHITFSYQQQKVLEDVTLTVEQGKFLGIVGPNGSGKSTLLKIILGLISPRQGEIKVFNEPIRKWKERWRMGYVPQKSNSFQLDFPATVREVVAAGLAGKKGLFKRFGKQDYQQVEEVLEQVEMASFMDRNIGQLSGGQQQRVFIARALISNPDLLILDEPTVGIDRNSTAKFYTLLERLHQQQGLTLILVTHDIGVVSSLVDQVACLNKQLFFHGDRTEFVEREEEILSLAYNHNVQVIEHQH